MEKELGLEKTRALIKYEGVLSLTKAQASEILESIYPKAPEAEKTRAVLLCASYQLNPLMKHIYLIKFKKWDKEHKEVIGETWATVMGIKAKRLLASRRGNYSYVDNTPRVMTEAEQKTIFGEVATDRFWVITKVKDPKTQAEAVGYGCFLNSEKILKETADKGNTRFNMAAIRSESQALDRLRPGEMPVGIEVVPEEAIEGQFEVVEDKVEPEPAPEPEPIKPEICKDCPTWEECLGSNQEDCKRREEGKAPPPPTKPEGEHPDSRDESKVTEDDLAQLNKLMEENNISASQLGKYMKVEKGWAEIQTLDDLKKWQLNELLTAFKKGEE